MIVVVQQYIYTSTRQHTLTCDELRCGEQDASTLFVCWFKCCLLFFVLETTKEERGQRKKKRLNG